MTTPWHWALLFREDGPHTAEETKKFEDQFRRVQEDALADQAEDLAERDAEIAKLKSDIKMLIETLNRISAYPIVTGAAMAMQNISTGALTLAKEKVKP